MKRSMLMLTGCAVLMFTACGKDTDNGKPDGNGDGSNPTQPTQPTTITVSGKVITEDGKPVANATVLVMGKTSVTSDASGAFSVADVKAPYDIIAVDSTKHSAIVFKGATRTNPMLSLPEPDDGSMPGPGPSGTITGTIKGAQTPSATVGEPTVKFMSALKPNTVSSFDASNSSFSANVDWDTGASLSGSLIAFQGERDSNSSLITKFTGFGRRDNVTLGNGATLANQELTLNAVTNSTLKGNISVPEGRKLFLTGVDMRFSPELSLQVQGDLGGPAAFNYAVPVVPQTTFGIAAFALGGSLEEVSFGIKQGLAAGTTANLDLKAPPAPLQPADKATGVGRSTEFSWNSTSGGVYLTRFEKKMSEPALAAETPFTILVLTSESRTSIPDLSALGMALPVNTDFTWSVGVYSPLTSVDPLLVQFSSNNILPTGLTELYASLAAPREFKTAATP